MSWADYGFPDVTMITNYTAMKALHASFRERLIHTRYYDESEAYTPDFFKLTSSNTYPYALSQGWDVPSRQALIEDTGLYLGLHYINQFLDLDVPIDPQFESEPGYPEEPPKLFLNENIEIKKIIEERDTTGLGYIGQDRRMLPEWSKTWIQQRYLAYNLTRLLEVPLVLTFCYGSGNSQYGGTAQDAFDNAKANANTVTISTCEYLPGISIMDRGASMFTKIEKNKSIYGIYYSCEFYRVLKIDIDYGRFPSFLGLPSYLYVSAIQTGPLGDTFVFDDHGFPIREGVGLFTKINLPWENFDIAPPNMGLTEGNIGYSVRGDWYLWYASRNLWQYGVVDASSWFDFYDDVDNP